MDILVNNAGKTWGAPLEEYPMKSWEMVMKVNVSSPFQLTKELLPVLREAGTKEDPARVINIGSPAGSLSGGLNAYAYNTSKAALHHLTRVLAKDLAKENINVNTISPGPFPSKMTEFKVGEDSPLIGKTLKEFDIENKYNIQLYKIIRTNSNFKSELSSIEICSGDIFILHIDVKNMLRFRDEMNVKLLADVKMSQQELTGENHIVVEGMSTVNSGS